MQTSKLIKYTSNGIYIPAADIYVDPERPVHRAVITHGHSDHAKPGTASYLTHRLTAAIMRHRIKRDLNIQELEYGETVEINGINFSLIPSGHVIGAAQVRIQGLGEVAVVTGDYKLEDDNISGVFEPIKCDVLVTESTFAMPHFRWQPQSEIFADVNQWWAKNKAEGYTSIIFGYSLGKVQRILANLDHTIGNVFSQGAAWEMTEAIREAGVALPPMQLINEATSADELAGSMLLITNSALPFLAQRIGPFRSANASGWMKLKHHQLKQTEDNRAFVISDHVDWGGIFDTVENTGAGLVYVTHGYKDLLCKYINKTGVYAAPLETAKII